MRHADQKRVLDVCCGGRMFWFDKANPDVLFVDERRVSKTFVGKGRNGRMFSCDPDRIGDFRNLDFPSASFSLVVFDPPHLTSLGKNSYMAQKYGRLDKRTWREDIAKGFNECFRVLKRDGVLIFKWNEYDITLTEVLKLAPHAPLFGHPSGKMQLTHWVAFMKPKT